MKTIIASQLRVCLCRNYYMWNPNGPDYCIHVVYMYTIPACVHSMYILIQTTWITYVIISHVCDSFSPDLLHEKQAYYCLADCCAPAFQKILQYKWASHNCTTRTMLLHAVILQIRTDEYHLGASSILPCAFATISLFYSKGVFGNGFT